MDAMIKQASDYGIAGLVIVALFYGLWFVMREHKAERKEWLEAYKENTEVLRSFSSKCLASKTA